MWVYRNGSRFSVRCEGNAFIPYIAIPGTHILIHLGNDDCSERWEDLWNKPSSYNIIPFDNTWRYKAFIPKGEYISGIDPYGLGQAGTMVVYKRRKGLSWYDKIQEETREKYMQDSIDCILRGKRNEDK